VLRWVDVLQVEIQVEIVDVRRSNLIALLEASHSSDVVVGVHATVLELVLLYVLVELVHVETSG
jgi:hypothetical protein